MRFTAWFLCSCQEWHQVMLNFALVFPQYVSINGHLSNPYFPVVWQSSVMLKLCVPSAFGTMTLGLVRDIPEFSIVRTGNVCWQLVTGHIYSEADNKIGGVLSVCFHSNLWTAWRLTLLFCLCVGHDHSLVGIEVKIIVHVKFCHSCPKCAGCRHQLHTGSKTLQQQHPPVLNWRCRLP